MIIDCFLWPCANEVLAEEWKGAKEPRKTRWDGEDKNWSQFRTVCKLQFITTVARHVVFLTYEQSL